MSENVCFCGSQKPYIECCRPYHEGKEPETALALMKSRFSAYAMDLPEYLIRTTHPASPFFHNDEAVWKEELHNFCRTTRFEKLEVLDSKEKDDQAMVVFVAHLTRFKKDATFTERSLFEKVNGKWLYRRGHMARGKVKELVEEGELHLLPLAYYGDKVLRQAGEPISEITDEIKTLAHKMIYMMNMEDGVGLAAPQVHQSLRMFVILTPHEDSEGHIELGEPKVLINPQISEVSHESVDGGEGCLSIPGMHGNVERAQEITVEYETLDGEVIKETVRGYHARVIQHEFDHINGVLYIDRLSEEEKRLLSEPLKKLEERVLKKNKG